MTPSARSTGRPRGHHPRLAWLMCAVLVAITVVAYLPVFHAGFVGYDDNYRVRDNPYVQAGPTGPSLIWAFATSKMYYWHPLTWISHMLDCQFYDLHPLGHHITNLVLHVANVLLLFLALSRLTSAALGSDSKAFWVAALFAVHPMNVENVAWISSRVGVLSTFFWMLTLLAYISYVRRGGPQRYLLVVFVFILGLLSKPMLVSLPMVLLILDYWPLGRLRVAGYRFEGAQAGDDSQQPVPTSKLILEKLPLFALSAALGVVTLLAQKGPTEVTAGHVVGLPLALRIDNAVVSYVAYLIKMIWPAKLAVFYPHPLRSIPIWQIGGSGLLLALMSALAVVVRKERPYVLVGWLWYVVTLIPVIGLVGFGEQAMADRYAYIPYIGVFIMVVWGAYDLVAESRRGRAALIGAAGAVVAVLIACTHVQAGYWRDSISLFTHALEVTRDNYVAHLNLGAAFEERGEWEAAKHHYEEAMRLHPDWQEALYNYGVLLGRMGDTEGAIAFYRRTLHIWPGHVQAHYNLGLIYDEQGRIAAAIREYEAALRTAPDYVAAHNNLAVDFYMTGQYKRAWRQVRAAQALGFAPDESFLRALSSKMPEPAR